MPFSSQASDTLETQERRLRVLFDSLPALIAYWDRDLRNVIANRAYVQWFGYSPEQMLGMHIRHVLGEAVYAKNLPYIEGVLAGKEQLFERTLVDTTGVTHHTQASYVPDVVNDQIVGFFVLVTDVTPRVEAERGLAEAQRLAELGSWQLDVASGVVSWSAELYRITGLDPDGELPSVERYLAMVHPEDRDRLAANIQAAATTATGYEIEYRLVCADGVVRDIQGRGLPELDADGAVVRLRGTVQDVTAARRAARELARANDDLARANRLQADMIGTLGHDVRQPLTGLLGYLDDLVEDWDSIPEARKRDHLRRANSTAHRLKGLIDDVLTMANLDAGTIATRPARVPLAEAVSDAVRDGSGALAVDVEVDAAAVAVVDPFHLRQILTNLIGNAVKYGEPPFSVTGVSAGHNIVVSVSDNGEGVPDEFVPHLFERFTRATSGVATRMQGTGFGLYIVQRLVEANGGRVSYRHHPPHGACFTVTFPAADVRTEGAEPAASADPRAALGLAVRR